MSLCRRVQCAVCEAIYRTRRLACVGALGLPLLATGCSGVMQLAGADLMSATGDDGLVGSEGSLAREGSARSRRGPSLMAAENSLGADDAADVGPLAALSAIEVSGDSSGQATAGPRDRTPARVARRTERAAPTGPVSIFADVPSTRGVRAARRDDLTLAAAQEDVPAARRASGPRADDSAPAETMTVEQVVQTSMRHPLLALRLQEIKIAEAKLIGAGAFPNPQIVLDTDTPTQAAGPTSVGSRIMFTIPLGGKRNFAQQVADIGIRRAQLAASRETEFIVDESVAAALEVLYLQELVALQAAQVDLANELVEWAQPPVVPESDRLSASVAATGLELQRLKALSALRVSRARLSKAMGLNPPRAIRVEGSLGDQSAPEVRLDTLLAAVRENRPEIAEARLSIAQSQRQLALEHANAIPDIDVGPRFEDEFRSDGDSMGGRLDFSLPIFYRNEGGIAESTATVGLNRAMLGVTEMATLNEVAAAYAELAPLQSRLAYYRDTLPQLTAEAEAAIRAAFKIGKIDFNNVVNDQQRLARLKIEHLNLKYQYNRLRARIELYAGRSLERLADMESAAPPDTNPFHDDPPRDVAPPSAPSRDAPSLPRARKDETEVDSRVARTGTRSGVVPASGESSGTPSFVSPLDYVKRLTQRKEATTVESLPYAGAKPSASARR